MHGDNTTAEVWKPIEENPDYEVSNQGRVRSLKHGKVRVLRPYRNNKGYLLVSLMRLNKRKHRTVHSLVLTAFVGPRPDGYEACHNDGTRTNNTLSNLRWGTAKGNAADRVLHGTSNRGEVNGHAKLTEADVLAIRADTRPQKVIAADYGIAQSNVSRAKSRRAWGHVPVGERA